MPPLQQLEVPGALGSAATGAWSSFEAQLELPAAPSAAHLASAVGRTVVVASTDGRFRREIISKIDPPTDSGGPGIAYLRLDPANSASRISGYRLVHRLWDALEVGDVVSLTPAEIDELRTLAEAEPAVARTCTLWSDWREGDGDLEISSARFAQLLIAEAAGQATSGRERIADGG